MTSLWICWLIVVVLKTVKMQKRKNNGVLKYVRGAELLWSSGCVNNKMWSLSTFKLLIPGLDHL